MLNYIAKTSLQAGIVPKNIIIFLHGYGADASNLVSLWRDFDGVFEDAIFIFPNAPEAFEFGPPGFQWYSLMDRSREALLEKSYIAQQKLNQFIEQVLTKYQADESALSLFGFSQGAMVSIFTGIRLAKTVKCIIGFSGTLIAPDIAKDEAISKPPICMIHGEQDMVVPVSLGKVAYSYLKDSGFNVQFNKISNLEHSIDSLAIEAAVKFIQTL